jgi:acyl-CoA thioesterase-1
MKNRCCALAVAALLTGCGRTPDPLAGCRIAPDATVLAIGDSLTRGHGAPGRGYPEQLQALLDASRPGLSVVNLGIDGERSAGLADRIGEALAEHRPGVVLITSGGNDFLRRVPRADTRRHLRSVLAQVREAGALPLLFAVPEPSLGAAVGRPSDHPLYAELGPDVVLIADVVSEVLRDDALKADAIHPNAAGYAKLAEAAAQRLARCD